jgi:citrate synthase
MAIAPVLFALTHQRLSKGGKEKVKDFKIPELQEDGSDYEHARLMLAMIHNQEMSEVSDDKVRALDTYLTLHAAHGDGNASTNATAQSTSTGNERWTVLGAGLNALKGPRHGGAGVAILNTLQELEDLGDSQSHSEKVTHLIAEMEEAKEILKSIKTHEANGIDIDTNNLIDAVVEPGLKNKLSEAINLYEGDLEDIHVVKAALNNSAKISGLGHAVYKKLDPRARVTRIEIDKWKNSKDSDLKGLVESEQFQLACELEDQTKENKYCQEKGLFPNVDLYAPFILKGIGVEPKFAAAAFAVSRVVGWGVTTWETAKNAKLHRPAECVLGTSTEDKIAAAGFQGDAEKEEKYRKILKQERRRANVLLEAFGSGLLKIQFVDPQINVASVTWNGKGNER